MLSSESDTEVGCVSAVFDVVLLSLSVLGDVVPLTLVIQTQRYMWSLDKSGCIAQQIVLAELLPLMAKYTPPFNKSVKSQYN